ncbi:DEAD/DEAH box helicase [Mongoliimonas terrestris]|uniref:DEAD/DEAH box helicase n=1 Tax=Mongoliimonas terrestris TaxID=1709001 RepID=UPI000949A125|nr:DEAD/DEAH box helicase [Mongoliimonas terrestris]
MADGTIDPTRPAGRTPEPSSSAPASGAPARAGGSADPIAAVAIRLAAEPAAGDRLVLMGDEGRASALAAALSGLGPVGEILLLPRWDVPPGEAVSPSRAVMGRRVAVIRRLASGSPEPRLVVTTADAALQRLPPARLLAETVFPLSVDAPLDLAAFRRFLVRTGWAFDDRVDEPGEVAIRGQVIDVYPADAAAPFRLDHADGRVTAIHRFDPLSQRTTTNGIAYVDLWPTSEAVEPDAEPDPQSGEPGTERERDLALEADLPGLYGTLDDLFALMGDAAVLVEPAARRRAAAILDQAADDHRARRMLLDRATAERVLAAATDLGIGDTAPVPLFAARRGGAAAFRTHVDAALQAGDRVLIAAADPRDGTALARRLGRTPEPVDAAGDALRAPAGSLLGIAADLPTGVRLAGERLVVVTASDVLGRRAHRAPAHQTAAEALMSDGGLAVGDAVIHVDHGLGILRGLEAVAGEGGETVRLEYAGGAVLMVPVAEMDRIWRYGGDPDAVTLDRLDGDAWPKRRAKVEAALGEAAARLAAAARERAERAAPAIRPPADRMERFAAGFGYAETPDQGRAIEAVLADLAAGRPMNRLVCGDVGYGKTEVALRAIAAVALAGHQVALVAPTTVLARQHMQTVAERFRGLGITVGHLSRFVPEKERAAVRAGLADGSVRVVVGTHAVAAKGVSIPDLALLVIDEEQRFGAAQKASLRALGADAHVLTLTATPIPRTLQGALAGLSDISVVATPPALRRPIATRVLPWSDEAAAQALRAEARRRGQSFVVCPRIEDLDAMAARLAAIAPDLAVAVLHARLPADVIDRTLLAFGRGEGDVLLATSIVESGLDMPRVNTMLLWHADRFGLAQLHQLRGRVGRGTRRGVALLFTDPDAPPAEATAKRLATLVALDQLGAGFAIAASDLDQRGAGDLFGEDQTGHVKLIGAGLYRHMLERALLREAGTAVDETPPPEIRGVDLGRIPPDFVPEPDVRLDLYARAYRLGDPDGVEAFAEEMKDRFGAPPPPVQAFLAVLRLRVVARALGIRRVDLGPQALACTLGDAEAATALAADLDEPLVAAKDDRVLVRIAIEEESARIATLAERLEAVG